VALLLAVLMMPPLGRAESVPLRFDTFAPAANVPNMNHELGPGYTGGLTMDFLNVATCAGTTIDARVTAVVRPGTQFATGITGKTARGFIPNYKATAFGQPSGDLGFLYAGVGSGTAGITLTIVFFDGTGSRRGTFRNEYVVPDCRLLIYDVDGEPEQAEWFEASYADGLYSHATGTAPTKVTAIPTPTGVRFAGCGKNCRETDTSGAVVLRYCRTSRITLAFRAEQYEDVMNPVFSAIDGDLNLPVTGDFQAPKVVPEPLAAPPTPVAPSPKPVTRVYPVDNGIRLERVAPAEVPLHVPFEYTIKITNVTEAPVQDVVVWEQLPKNFTLQSANPEPKKDGADLSWTIGTLAPKAGREIKVTGIATTADILAPCATVTFLVPPVCASIAVVEPKLTLTAAAPREVLVGDPVQVQFVVANSGTGAAQEVRVVGTLPAGLRAADGRTEWTHDIGTLPPGQSRQLAGSFKAAKTGQYVTRATAQAQGGVKAEATATTIVRQPVLALAKTGPARQYLGRPITYEIAVTNEGDAPAAETVVEDTLPPGVQGLQTTPAGTHSGAKVVWRLGTLAVGASRKVSLTYTPAEAGTLAQVATAAAVAADPVTATAKTTMYGIAAVLLEVIDTDDPIQIGGRTTYLITATNQGSSPSTDVQIAVAVEEAQEIVATNGPTPVTVVGRTAKSAPLASLAPKAKATWQITVKALKPGDVRFRATLTTAQLERTVEETEATQLYE